MNELLKRLESLPLEKQELVLKKLRKQKLISVTNNGYQVPTIIPVRRDQTIPLSFIQERLWFVDQLEGGSSAYNMPAALRLTGTLNLVALEQSLAEIVQRHEVLRTTFPTINGVPHQVVAPFKSISMLMVDLQGLPLMQQEAEVQRLAVDSAEQLFDLAKGPLLQTTLLRLAEDQHVLLFTMHHIISDGWSMAILIREVVTLYEAFSKEKPTPERGRGVLPKLPIQYADFAYWQRQRLSGQLLSKQLSYWKEQLAGASYLNLPPDRPRTLLQNHQGESQSLTLSKDLTEALKSLANQEETTLFMTLLAAFKLLLSRYTGQENIIVGTPIAGRHQGETEGLIGCFLNTLALHTDLSGNPSFRRLLSRVREVVIGAFDHQDLPFEKLVEELQPERDLNRHPIFDVLFNFVNTPSSALELPGLTITPLELGEPEAKFSLTLYVEELAGELSLSLVYRQALFSAERMGCLLDQFQHLLDQIVADPDRAIRFYSLVTPQSQARLPEPSAVLPEPRHEAIPIIFTSWANRLPEQPAVCQGERTFSYRELSESSQHIARVLLAHGVEKGDVVAVYGSRSFGLIASMMGVLFSGGVLLTIDPILPSHRQQIMLREANTKYLLHVAPQHPEDQLIWESLDIIEIAPNTGRATSEEREEREWNAIPLPELCPEDAAYIFFTSGTTGIPKGVLGCHKGLSHFLNWQRQTFAVGPQDRSGQLTALSFDVLLRDVFLPLTSGATLCLPTEVNDLGAQTILPWLETEQITLLHTVPSLAKSWLANVPQGVSLHTLRCVFFAGEPLTDRLINQWRDAFGEGGQIVNLYGPTETTMAKCYYRVPTDLLPGVQPVGSTLPETQALVLRHNSRTNHQLCGIGEPGEIVIRTPFRTLGYINARSEDEPRFVKNPATDLEQDLLYHTGDLGRYRPDGSLEILGRIDHQVKIRGVRIEPKEIEAVLTQHPAVWESVVIAHADSSFGDKRLVAYVVPTEEAKAKPALVPTSRILRHFVKSKLPQYMVPAAFVLLESLPLTTNGKVNRRALPEPKLSRETLAEELVEPRTPTQEALAAIWANILTMEQLQVGIHDNFFDLGGHSLLAPQVIWQVRELLSVELSLRSLFEYPTIAALSDHVEMLQKQVDKEESELPIIVPAPEKRDEPFPLTDLQQAYWVGRYGTFELNAGSNSYRELEMTALELERLSMAWQRIIERHDALRIVVLPNGQQQVRSEIPPMQIPILDLRGQDKETVAKELAARREQMSRQTFQADQWPLFDVRVTLLDNQSRLHFSRDLLVADAWSLQLIFQELLELYQNPDATLEPLELSFRDVVMSRVAQQDSPKYKRDLAYWQERVPNFPKAPELPLAKNPSTLTSHRFTRLEGRLDAQTWQRLRKRTTQAGLAPSVPFCAAYASVLTTWSNNLHFTINVLHYNRLPLHPQVMEVVGNLSSTILLEVNNSAEETFEKRAQRLQEQLWRDLEHNLVTGVQVLRELNQLQGDLSRATMPVVFSSVLASEPSHHQTQKRVLQEVDEVYASLQTPQVFLDHQVAEADDGSVSFIWDFVKELFPEGLVEEIFEAYVRLLHRLANEDEAWQETPLRVISPMMAKQVEVNATEAPIEDKHLHTLFIEQVPAQLKRPAVMTSTRTLTYEELYLRSLQLGYQLRELGTRPNMLIGVVMEKGWEQVAAVLAIQMAGGAYVPIDPALPKERRWQLMEQSEIQIVLTQSWLDHRLQWPERVQRVHVDHASLANPDLKPLEPIQQTEDLAYIIYTSGSTGVPKGVMIDHRGAVNTLLDINRRFAINQEDKVFALSSLSFDLSVYDIFGTLAAGATIVMPDAGASREPIHWLELMEQTQTTVWDSVPALMQLLLEYVAGSQRHLPASLKLVMMSGDWIPLNLPSRIKALAEENIKIISLGGATEASIWSIFYPIEEVDPTWKSIPYGRPLTNQTFHVLDDALEPCPVWVPGQLYIGGIGVAKGYWRNEAKTKASFIIHPRTGERLYRTGDLGRYFPDGHIEFLGREDFQVKVQGYRIECGEIEAILLEHPAVQSVVVTAVGERFANKQLVAYIVPASEAPTSSKLRDFLQQKVPHYMVPSLFMMLPALPLTSNGKVNRRALPTPDSATVKREANFVPPRNTLELQLVPIWETLLDVHPISVRDSFFELGGHSLLAVRLISQIQQQFGKNLPLATLFQDATIEQLAQVLRQQTDSRFTPLVPIQPNGQKPPFFSVHPVGGHVLCYRELAHHLPEQPFYGLQAVGSQPSQQPHKSIEAMASEYIQAIQTVQPEGPYYLGGWSLGGLIAFEIAQQLQRQGGEVALLALIDSWALLSETDDPSMSNANLVTAFANDLFGQFGQELPFDSTAIQQLDLEQQLHVVWKEAQEAQLFPSDLALTQAEQLLQLFKANLQAELAYRPTIYSGDVQLLRASEQPTPDQATMGWEQFVTGDVSVHHIPGTHYTIVQEPQVAFMAQTLAQCLEEAQKRHT